MNKFSMHVSIARSELAKVDAMAYAFDQIYLELLMENPSPKAKRAVDMFFAIEDKIEEVDIALDRLEKALIQES